MIDITSNSGKQKLLVHLTRMQQRLEAGFIRDVSGMLKRQYRDAAKLIEDYRPQEIDTAVEKYRRDLFELLMKRYKIAADTFSKEFFSEAEKSVRIPMSTKASIDLFATSARSYIVNLALKRVTQVTDKTKEDFRTVLNTGLEEGLSNTLIAKKLIETGGVQSVYRSARIARTEVHSMMAYSIQESARITGLVKKKEWISANDQRTRTGEFNHVKANGETVDFGDNYHDTGEPLRFPGDPNGSAGNIIHCRCVEIYHTKI